MDELCMLSVIDLVNNKRVPFHLHYNWVWHKIQAVFIWFDSSINMNPGHFIWQGVQSNYSNLFLHCLSNWWRLPLDDGIVYSYFNRNGHIIVIETTNTAQSNYVEAGQENTFSCRGCNELYYDKLICHRN